LRYEIGAVGAKLIYPNNTIQHAGVEFKKTDQGEIPFHPFQGVSSFSHGGSGAPINTTRNPIAVTAACLMIEKKKFIEVGMFDEDYIIAYQDIDLCLKLNKQGFRTLYHPKSVWKHFESITRKTDLINDNQTRDYSIFLEKSKNYSCKV
jgi:GT2 family glycosyltransferase